MHYHNAGSRFFPSGWQADGGVEHVAHIRGQKEKKGPVNAIYQKLMKIESLWLESDYTPASRH